MQGVETICPDTEAYTVEILVSGQSRDSTQLELVPNKSSFRKRFCIQPVLKERWQPTTVYPAYNNNWECKNTIKLLFFAQRRDDGHNCIYYTLNSIKQLLDSVFIL